MSKEEMKGAEGAADILNAVVGVIRFGGEIITEIAKFCSGGDYESNNKRFEFKMRNSTGIAMKLKSQDKWFGNLETPCKYVPNNGTLKIRGYKIGHTAQGVTYLLGFQLDPKEYAHAKGHLLYVYLSVVFDGNLYDNYFGWSFEKENPELTAAEYYGSAKFDIDRTHLDSSERVLVKGGKSTEALLSFGHFWCEMLTDNQSWSHPVLTLSKH
jgi:hypothetical protein